MLGRLFLLFALIPAAEIYFLIKVGSAFGAITTIFLVIFTAFAGAWLARMEGMQTMIRVRESINQGLMPAEEIIDALIIFVAGIVLLTPGFLTDIAGLLLLFPPSRNLFKRWLRRKMDEWRQNPNVHVTYYHRD